MSLPSSLISFLSTVALTTASQFCAHSSSKRKRHSSTFNP
jgi:hypothetical protein